MKKVSESKKIKKVMDSVLGSPPVTEAVSGDVVAAFKQLEEITRQLRVTADSFYNYSKNVNRDKSYDHDFNRNVLYLSDCAKRVGVFSDNLKPIINILYRELHHN